MAHLVRHGDVGDGGRDRLAVVEQSHDARVQALQAAAVMLKEKGGTKNETGSDESETNRRRDDPDDENGSCRPLRIL